MLKDWVDILSIQFFFVSLHKIRIKTFFEPIIVAHILQDDDKVTEIYVCDGSIRESQNVLFVYKSGKLEMKWCCGTNVTETQVNPTLEKVGKRMLLEYGEPNLFQIRQRLPFQDEQGNLDKIWTKIM